MKKTLFTMVLCGIFILNLKAQQWSGNQNTTDNINRTGNVSIGTANATEKLNIRGNIQLMGMSDYSIYSNSIYGRTGIYCNLNSASGPFLEMFGKSNAGNPGVIALGSHGTTGETWFTNYNPNTNSWTIQAKITAGGRFVIGDCNPWAGNYGLYVQKGILTSEIKVALPNTNDWSDYVFAPDYKLMPLPQLQQYIDENNHLPDVPSAEEVSEKGINLGKMDATLLKKIEELTLYTLELNKQLVTLQEKISTLELKK